MRSLIAYALLIAVVIGVLAVVGLTTLHRMVAQAEAAARAERDAHWTAEIARANAETEKRLRLAEMAKQAADTAARDAITAITLKLTELETANEALPDNRCGGLGRDRVELLLRGPR